MQVFIIFLAAVVGFAFGAFVVWAACAAKMAGLRAALRAGEELRGETERRTAEAMEAGLYRVPNGLRSTLNPASASLVPILSEKQLPSRTVLSSRPSSRPECGMSISVLNFISRGKFSIFATLNRIL